MPSIFTSCTNGFEPPIFPVTMPSDRRLAVLDEFNVNFLGAQAPEDRVFARFLKDFPSMGPIDAVSSCLSGNGKAAALSGGALCHVASIDSGRDYLIRTGKLKDAEEASVVLLHALDIPTRAKMLQDVTLGEQCQIVLRFPASDLRMALAAPCFENRPDAMLPRQARKAFLLNRSEHTALGSAPLLQCFIEKMNGDDAPSLDVGVWKMWHELIECCIDRRAISDVTGNTEEFSRLGHALRALAKHPPPNRFSERLPIAQALWNSAAAFQRAGDITEHERGLADASEYEKHITQLVAAERQALQRANTTPVNQGFIDMIRQKFQRRQLEVQPAVRVFESQDPLLTTHEDRSA